MAPSKIGGYVNDAIKQVKGIIGHRRHGPACYLERSAGIVSRGLLAKVLVT